MRKIFTFIIPAVFITAFSIAAFGQTTSFVYQGKLQDAGVAANGQSLACPHERLNAREPSQLR